jgi:transcriptional regulator with PAS, ATPase and Fis domain
LQNIIERIIILSKAEEIKLSDLPARIKQYYKSIEAVVNSPEQYNLGFPLKDIMALIEKEIIHNTLKNSCNLKEAAKLLDIDLSTLVRKKRRYKL